MRGLLLGAAITLVFTAANVYLGLKVGLTFASTIPAAVISMAVLRAVKNATIVENNIVQTVASAAGTLSAVIFVLPGLVMIGWWSGFPFWETFGVCAAGGILGVMYSVPLRRALVVQSDLPYPEGVAAAEVLKVGAERSPEASGGGLRALVTGSLASFGFAAVVASQLFTGEIDEYGRIGPSTTGIGFALSLALIGAGHLIGLTVGIAILAGLVIAWGVAIPLLTALHPLAGDAATVATAVWSHQVRFIGAGAIGIASIWTIGQLVKPVVNGLRSSIQASRHAAAGNDVPITERDLPIGTVAIIAALSLIPVALLFVEFLRGSVPPGLMAALVAGAVAYVVVAGFAVAAACGYMAGLIGSSNSPVSGLAILAVIGASLLLVALAGSQIAALGHALVAYSLFVTAILLCVATIANDNLQDLKTGQLVGATPWKQQVALIAGVIAGSLVIPPILNVLAHAYGFPGAPAHGNIQPLAAPQATLISALARGVIQGQIDWRLIGAGAILGAAIVAIDELLRKTTRLRLPPLAVGLGIYLPASSTAPVVVGAVAGFYFNRWAARQRDEGRARQMGVLVASGFIVGESLFGVLLAGLIVTTGRPTPLAVVGDGFAMPALLLGAAGFVIVVAALYRAAASLYLRSERRSAA
ncbi:MAG TPA: oligopeptide transporter, OPT family [Candidatus Tumulicola sp.]